MPPQQSNQYDFIVSYNGHHAGSWLLRASLKTRIMVVGGGLIVLLLLGWIFVALLTAGSNAGVQNLTALTEEQTELARISLDPTLRADQATTQNFASTTRLSLMSDEQAFVDYLTSVNATPSADTLALGRNGATDTQLQNARASGTYDQTYISIARTQLQTYAGNLQRAFNATSNRSERQLLSSAYAHAQLLLALSGSNS